MGSGFVIASSSIKPLYTALSLLLLTFKMQNTQVSKLVLWRTTSGQTLVVGEQLATLTVTQRTTHAECEDAGKLALVLVLVLVLCYGATPQTVPYRVRNIVILGLLSVYMW